MSAMVDGNLQCVLDVWSHKSASPVVYTSLNLSSIEQDLTHAPADAVVSLDIKTSSFQTRFYVWGDLRFPAARVSPISGMDGEVGIKLSPTDLVESTGKALVSRLLRKTMVLSVVDWEVEDLFSQMQSKVAHGEPLLRYN